MLDETKSLRISTVQNFYFSLELLHNHKICKPSEPNKAILPGK